MDQWCGDDVCRKKHPMTESVTHYRDAWLSAVYDATGDYEKAKRAIELADLNGLFDPIEAIAAPAQEAVTLAYVKRWRTIVKLPAKYADEIVEALRIPDPAQRPVNPVTDAMVEAGAKALCLAQFGEEATHGDARCCQVGGKDGCCLHEVRKDALACLEAALSSLPSTKSGDGK